MNKPHYFAFMLAAGLGASGVTASGQPLVTGEIAYSISSPNNRGNNHTPGARADTAKDFILQNLDTSVKPGNDFFKFANGGWIKRNPIPASESSWGIGNLVEENIKAKLKVVNENAAAASSAPGTDLQKLGDFYRTAMDSVKADRLGVTPMKSYLDEIDAIHDLKGIWAMAAKLQRMGESTFFNYYVGQDAKNSEKIQVHIGQGGLGLPNRDFYFSKLARFVKIRNAYPGHIEKMLSFTGLSAAQAATRSQELVKFETVLAKVSRPLADLRDPYANYHKMGMKELGTLLPSVNWLVWIKATGLNGVDSVIVGQPEFLQALDNEMKSTSVEVLKSFLKWNFISDYASSLSSPVNMERFRFYNTIVSGQTSEKPRWKRVIEQENRLMGMLLGKLFIKEYFSDAAKKRYEDMVSRVQQVYAGRINKLDWMSDTTKAKAIVKLTSIKPKVGFPDKWLDYSRMKIGTVSYFENLVQGRLWSYNYEISQYGKPVDRTRWDMYPQTYNAYYNPSNNEIVLPAAQMAIPGLRDEEIDDAVAYGYTAGSTIGHEITHGFDDQGRQFDEKGNLKSWWTKGDEQRFTKKAKVLSDQFDSYVVLDSMHVNGKASLGENMADLGGIRLGLEAFKMTDQYKKGEKLHGYTPVQRYFLGYAMGWLSHERDESLARQILSDVHAPANLRVNGPLSDIPEFYDAFNVQPGEALYRKPEDRAKIW